MPITVPIMFRPLALSTLSIAISITANAAAPSPQLPASARAIHIDAPAATGLNGGVYVLPETAGLQLSVNIQPGQTVRWQTFDQRGAAYATDITPAHTADGTSVIELTAGDCGVVVDVDNQATYLWLVDYSQHPLHLSGVVFAPEQDCDRTTLQLQGTGDRIVYYGINGNATELSRNITVSYNTLKYNPDTRSYEQQAATADTPYLKAIGVTAPLCDTQFTVTGDRFTAQWGQPQTVHSPLWQARAVEAESWAEQVQRDVPNEVKDQSESLGGSAPCEINFSAAVTDAAIFREWQLSTDPDFNNVDLRANELDFSYTFRETGRSYVRFVAADASGNCTATGPVYEVNIGESSLRCPNVFTPFTTPGVNDEWRVSYRSLVSYECHIFNMQGQEVFASTDPARGWDGRYRGRKCPTGTYYYAIVAKGSDGKEYKLGGDINIVGGNVAAGTGGSQDSAE